MTALSLKVNSAASESFVLDEFAERLIPTHDVITCHALHSFCSKERAREEENRTKITSVVLPSALSEWETAFYRLIDDSSEE